MAGDREGRHLVGPGQGERGLGMSTFLSHVLLSPPDLDSNACCVHTPQVRCPTANDHPRLVSGVESSARIPRSICWGQQARPPEGISGFGRLPRPWPPTVLGGRCPSSTPGVLVIAGIVLASYCGEPPSSVSVVRGPVRPRSPETGLIPAYAARPPSHPIFGQVGGRW